MKNALLIVASGFLMVGCATPHQSSGPWQKQSREAGILTGAILGGIIGNNVGDNDNEVLGAVIGAALGGFAGDQYGQRQDYIDQSIDYNRRLATERIVYIQNSNGSYTQVKIVSSNGEWIGPRGEIYRAFPTDEQLKSVYGW